MLKKMTQEKKKVTDFYPGPNKIEYATQMICLVVCKEET